MQINGNHLLPSDSENNPKTNAQIHAQIHAQRQINIQNSGDAAEISKIPTVKETNGYTQTHLHTQTNVQKQTQAKPQGQVQIQGQTPMQLTVQAEPIAAPIKTKRQAPKPPLGRIQPSVQTVAQSLLQGDPNSPVHVNTQSSIQMQMHPGEDGKETNVVVKGEIQAAKQLDTQKDATAYASSSDQLQIPPGFGLIPLSTSSIGKSAIIV